MAAKKLKKSEEKKATTEASPKALSKEEMLQLDYENLKIDYVDLEFLNLQLQQKLIGVMRTNDQLNLQIKQKELEILEHRKQALNNKKAGHNETRKSYADMLKKKYKIEDAKWGFDPDTGEIILNEKVEKTQEE